MTATYEVIATGDLVPSPRNARTHDRKQIRQIAASIEQFGFSNPVLIDEANVLIAGHGRLAAAQVLGLKEVPAIRITHLSDAQKRALRIADNRIAEKAGWNMEILASELADLSSMELDFDLEVTGFEVGEIDIMIGSAGGQEGLEPETAPLPDPDLPQVARAGDLWLLRKHRVLCGNARNADDYATLMGDDLAHMVFADPPYNVPINGHVCGNGQVQHREFVEASGEMTSVEFVSFLRQAATLSARYSQDNATSYWCIDWRHLPELHAACTGVFAKWINLCVWCKTNAGMGGLYRSQHELICVFGKSERGHRNNIQLGKCGRNRSNVWTYAGVNTFRPGRMEELRAHPTAKPVAMIQDAILDVTKPGETVLDPFLGAGATLIAAEIARRVAYGMEIDPLYVDVVLRRWREATGQEPVRALDGQTLASLETAVSKETGQ